MTIDKMIEKYSKPSILQLSGTNISIVETEKVKSDLLELKESLIIEHSHKVKEIPKLPPHVVAWVGNTNEDMFFICEHLLGNEHYDDDLIPDDVENWIFSSHRNTLLILKIVMEDIYYEVEEEPKYYVEEPLTGQFLVRDGNLSGGYRWADGFTTSSESYSEREIKSIGERYWPFAVPVEKEVSE